MQKPRRILLVLLLLAIAIAYYYVVYIILPNEWQNIVSFVSGVVFVVTFFVRNERFFKRWIRTLKKYELFKLLFDNEQPTQQTGRTNAHKVLKIKLLDFTVKKYQFRLASNESSGVDMAVEPSITLGRRPENQEKDWKTHIEKQFVFITGLSGSGKSFELINRLTYLCNQINQQRDLPPDRKIPIYIELKSLDRPFDDFWICDYIKKSGNTMGIDFKDEMAYVEQLIQDDEITYFFDGLDEVKDAFRESCFEALVALSKRTGVHVTCRTEIFERLKTKVKTTKKRERLPLIRPIDWPLEYRLQPLSEGWIKLIIEGSKNHSDRQKLEILHFIDGKPVLLEHLSRPIMLGLFLSVFENLSPEKKLLLESNDEKQIFGVLWEAQENPIARAKLPTDADMLQLRIYTAWIAKIMQYEAFFVESIQPHWLRKINGDGTVAEAKALQRSYYVVTRIIAAVIIGVGMGCIVSTPFTLLANSVWGGTIIAGISGLYGRRLKRWKPWLSGLLFSVPLFILLAVACGFYQGFSVPRADEDMTTLLFSITESWSGVLLGIALSAIFSYRIILEKHKEQYILPIEQFHFNWGHALRYGFVWGVVGGVITGGIALFVKNQQTESLFFTNWLIPYLNKVASAFNDTPLSEAGVDIAIFGYAFLIMFIIATLLITILAGRYDDKPVTNEALKQQLNFGIRESGKYAVKNAFWVGLLACLLYLFAMLDWNFDSALHGIKIAFGVSLLGFLWFGGMEVINHYLLRLNLYVRGIAPLNYSPWVQANQNMNVFVRTGYKQRFYHDALATYYMDYGSAGKSWQPILQKKYDNWVYAVVLTIMALVLIAPFYLRYGTDLYWKQPSELVVNSVDLQQTADGTFLCQKTGNLQIAVRWRSIHVGTFVGRVFPHGTTYGFMGMPLDSAYNIPGFGRFRHGAILMRKRDGIGEWSAYEYVSTGPLQNKKSIPVRKGDQLHFLINDKEWQNNTGHFIMDMAIE